MNISFAAASSNTATIFIGTLMTSHSAMAQVPDLSYVRCSNGGGDFRISELNHSVHEFSVREQRYRPVCSDCDITEWGNRITMVNRSKTFIQLDRISGHVIVKRAGSTVIPGFSFSGTCAKGSAVVGRLGRVF